MQSRKVVHFCLAAAALTITGEKASAVEKRDLAAVEPSRGRARAALWGRLQARVWVWALLCVMWGCGSADRLACRAGEPVESERGLAPALDLEFGPLIHEFGLTLESGRRQEVLGPFLGAQVTEDGERWAFPPLVSYERVESTGWEQFDVLYPFLSYRRVAGEGRMHLFQLFSFATGGTTETNTARRFTIFPFYFQQRSTDPAQNYTAVLPFYGHLQNRFNRDAMTVVGFPLYLKSWKKGVETDNYLFPIVHVREGEGLDGWQVFPLVGHEHKDITTVTNVYGEAEVNPGHDKWFALWPLVAGQRTGIGTAQAKTNLLALPFYTSQRSAQRDQTSWLWPFFTATEDREHDYREWSGPWPFYGRARGPGKQSDRFWPLFGRSRKPGVEVQFWLWPGYRKSVVESPPLYRERTRIGFLIYTDLTERNLETGAEKKRLDLWPLFVRRQAADGSRRLQVLAPLEPLMPYNRSVERNYSPLWSLWRQEWNPRAEAHSTSVLWNTYRSESSPGRKKCSILFGLIRYQTGPEGTDLRLFYLPVSRHVPKHR